MVKIVVDGVECGISDEDLSKHETAMLCFGSAMLFIKDGVAKFIPNQEWMKDGKELWDESGANRDPH